MNPSAKCPTCGSICEISEGVTKHFIPVDIDALVREAEARGFGVGFVHAYTRMDTPRSLLGNKSPIEFVYESKNPQDAWLEVLGLETKCTGCNLSAIVQSARRRGRRGKIVAPDES